MSVTQGIALCGGGAAIFVVLFLLTPHEAQAEIEAKGEWPAVKVIDMHTHVFNARDLPLAGVLDALGAPRHVAALVAFILARSMPEEDDEPLRKLSPTDLERPTIAPLSDQERNVLLDYVDPQRVKPLNAAAANLEVQPDVTLLAEALAQIGFPPDDHPDEELLVPKRVDAAGLAASLKGYLRFIALMTKGHHTIVSTLKESYAADLFVHHMMDMAAAYDDTPGISFPEQNVAMQRLEEAYPGQLLHFTAFDPFRRT